jgi:glycerol kinase
VNTGSTPVSSSTGLLTTIAWQDPDGTITYALEGSVFVTGAAIQWLRDGLGIIESASDTDALARSVPDSGGVVFVPALTGLGAPDWDPHARGTILGLTRGTTRAHIVRATLEAIAFEVTDVVALMVREGEVSVPALRVDGGAAANDFLCQAQATALGVPLIRASALETTGLGAAFLAGLGIGFWTSKHAIAELVGDASRFTPDVRDERAQLRWRAAVERAKGWALV